MNTWNPATDLNGGMMPYLICPECAYSTDDWNKRLCEYCRTELLCQCPLCAKLIQEEKAIYCRECGVKLKKSVVPIQ
jgi:hypothetical protein